MLRHINVDLDLAYNIPRKPKSKMGYKQRFTTVFPLQNRVSR